MSWTSDIRLSDYVQLNDRGQAVRCEKTDFAYGVVTKLIAPDQVEVYLLGTDPRKDIPTRRLKVDDGVPDLSDQQAVEEWLAT